MASDETTPETRTGKAELHRRNPYHIGLYDNLYVFIEYPNSSNPEGQKSRATAHNLINLDRRIDLSQEPVCANEACGTRQQTVHNADHQTVGEVNQARHKVVNRQLLREEHHAVQKDVDGREGRHKETSPPPVVVLFESKQSKTVRWACSLSLHTVLKKKKKGPFRTSSHS